MSRLRVPRPVFSTLVAVVAVAAVAGACGGSDDGGDAAMDDTDAASEVVVDEVAADGAPSAVDLSPVVSAIEATGYECQPESFVMTSAIRETCLTTSSITLSAYAWASSELMAEQVDAEIFCTADSGLEQLTSLRGDTWAITALSLSGSNTPETQTAIDDALAAVSATLGGAVTTTACG